MLTLVLGGARSGKSAFAERLAHKAQGAGKHIVYVATGSAGDDEMAARISHHRARRPASWTTIEEPIALAEALAREARPDRFLLVDCLTLWLTNLLPADGRGQTQGALLEAERKKLIALLPGLDGDVVLVSNEVGLGLVSEHKLGRRFVDESGLLHQEIAAIAERVYFIAAGCPLLMKGDESPRLN